MELELWNDAWIEDSNDLSFNSAGIWGNVQEPIYELYVGITAPVAFLKKTKGATWPSFAFSNGAVAIRWGKEEV